MKTIGGIMAMALVVRVAAAGEPAALWDLAPPDTAWAVVVSDGSLNALRRGWEAVLATTGEELASIRDGLPPVVVRAAELDIGRGLAWYRTRAGEDAFVLPVADRARFRRTVGGLIERRNGRTLDRFDELLCGEARGRYVCATDDRLLDELGTSGAMAAEIAAWPADLRGDIEAYASEDVLPWAHGAPVRLSARLARGSVRLRAQVPGRVSAPPAPSALEARLADIGPAAFLVARQWPLHGGARDLLGELGDAWTGDLVAYALPGRPSRGIVKAAIRADRRVRAFLHDCNATSWEPWVTLGRGGGHCQARWRLPGLGEVRAEARLADDALVVGVGNLGPAVPFAELTPAARDLLGRRLTLTAWGRGIFARAAGPLASQLPLDRCDPRIAAAARRLLAHVTEMGLAIGADEGGLEAVVHVRTTFSYPDEVAAAVERLTARIAAGDATAFAALERLGSRYPGSDLAADVAAGPGMLGAGLVGAATALWSAHP